MHALLEPLSAIRDFLEAGGSVLWVILFATVLLWTLIIERFWYLRAIYPQIMRETLAQWQARTDKHSWYAHQIRRAMVSRLALGLGSSLPYIKTIITLCPLLGLLGTVTGMVNVFSVMAITGTGNVRAMASGVYMATIPTMAGLVAAISGLYFSARLQQRTAYEIEQASDLLRD